MTKAQREVRAIKRGVGRSFKREVGGILTGFFREIIQIGKAFTRAGR